MQIPSTMTPIRSVQMYHLGRALGIFGGVWTFFIAVLVNHAQAHSNSCHDLFATSLPRQQIISGRIIRTDGVEIFLPANRSYPLPLREFKEFADTVTWSNANLFSKMERPSAIELAIVFKPTGFADERFSVDGKQIMKAPIGRYVWKTKTRRAIDAHEYSHSVFDSNMGRFSEPWRLWYERMTRWQHLERTVYGPLRDKLESLEQDSRNYIEVVDDDKRRFENGEEPLMTSSAHIAYSQWTKQRRVEREKAKAELDTFDRAQPLPPEAIHAASAIYQELYADLAAVFRSSEAGKINPQFANSLSRRIAQNRLINGRMRLANLTRARGFSFHVPLDGYNERLRGFETHPHLVLNPARSFIGERYLSNPAVLQNPKEFMRDLFAVLAVEVIELSNSPSSIRKNAEVLNHSLIQRMSESLGSYDAKNSTDL